MKMFPPKPPHTHTHTSHIEPQPSAVRREWGGCVACLQQSTSTSTASSVTGTLAECMKFAPPPPPRGTHLFSSQKTLHSGRLQSLFVFIKATPQVTHTGHTHHTSHTHQSQPDLKSWIVNFISSSLNHISMTQSSEWKAFHCLWN